MALEPRSLGDFASERDAEEERPLEGLWFTLDGERFEFGGGDVNILTVSELASMALTGEDGLDQAATMASMHMSLKAAMGGECTNPEHADPKRPRWKCPGEYARFSAHVTEHKTPVSVVLQIVQMVNEAAQEEVEAATGRPTQRQSGSSAGLPGRDAQLSQLMRSDLGDVVTPGAPQAQPVGGPELPSLSVVRTEAETAEGERQAQQLARQAARNAALSVRTRQPAKGKRGGKARRTA